MRISIAMATYNGAKFLQEQLDSLATQTLLPHELVICDDGSTDATLEIAGRFAAEAPFPVRIYRNEKNLGYADNFLKAASLCEGDWIAFCDQDDVWLPEKLLTQSKNFSEDVLLVVHSADLADATLHKTGRRWPDLPKNRLLGPTQNRPWWTPAGFTQCFSASLIRNFSWQQRPRDFNYPERMQAHDEWIYFLANSFGSVAYIKKSLALYRRHVAATTGSYQTSLSERVRCVRAAGSKYYVMLADIADDYVATLKKIAPAGHDRARQSEIAQEYYARLGTNYRLRSRLHSGSGLASRLGPFLHLCRGGAYSSRQGKGLGIKAFVKDVVTLV